MLYIDVAAGAGGDMLAGAMAALAGWDTAQVEQVVQRLGLEGVQVQIVRRRQGAVEGVALEVGVHGPQPHRHLKEVLEAVEGLGGKAGVLAARVFRRLAEAEARVHGISPEQVHFHEVGAVDALVEVGVVASAFVELGAEKVVSSPLPLGRGWVRCAHGELPLPAPAVAELLKDAVVEGWPAAEETVTPTAAAIISTIVGSYGELPAMRLEAVATGVGKRNSLTGRPNILRLLLGQSTQGLIQEKLVEICFMVDDMDPEELAIALEQLRQAGAVDVVSWPVSMKKARTGTMVMVLATRDQAERLVELALGWSTTLGVRLRHLRRVALPRQVRTMPSPWGEVRIKLAQGPKGLKLKPEADDVARIARASSEPPWKIKRLLTALAYEHFNPEDGGGNQRDA